MNKDSEPKFNLKLKESWEFCEIVDGENFALTENFNLVGEELIDFSILYKKTPPREDLQ